METLLPRLWASHHWLTHLKVDGIFTAL